MAFDPILFDLDGTIIDPAIGITNSLQYALRFFGIEVEDRRTLYPFIGPPLWDSFERFFGFSKAEAEKAVAYYRENYRQSGIFECTLYEGMAELLQTLSQRGKALLLATSKPEFFAMQILERFSLSGYFAFVGGSLLDGTRVHKADVIRYALLNSGIQDTSRAVIVGDREYDILGGKAVGIHSVGVLFGYGSRAELEGAGADCLAETVQDLAQILLR